jgi:TrmH family RNA methyltransferase
MERRGPARGLSGVVAISARDNPLLARARRLAATPDAYRRVGQVLLEGEHLCEAWIARRGGAGVRAIVTEAAWSQAPLRRLAEACDGVGLVDERLMRAASTLESAPPILFLAPWPGVATPQPDAPGVLLDRLQDAGNVGTILRSAAAFGATQVLATKGTAALWSPKVLRAAMGAHLGLRLVEAADPGAVAAWRVPLVATSSHAGEPLQDAPLPWPCAWAFGHEGQGLASSLAARAALRVRIEQPGGQESLNVAAAAAICLYESARRRAHAEAAPRRPQER